MPTNRITAPSTFETLAPPWSLANLDTNFSNNQNSWNDSSLGFSNFAASDTGSTNAYAVTLPIGAPSAYNPGMVVAFNPANTNTGASTITISPLGSVAILYMSGSPLVGGEIVAGTSAFLIFNGTLNSFLLINPTLGIPVITNTGLEYVSQDLGVVTTNQTIDCVGAVAVSVTMSSGAPGLNLILLHLAPGVRVMVWLRNASGSALSIGVLATNPSGGAMSVQGTSGAGLQFILSNGVSFAANATHVFTGAATPTVLVGTYN
jgi:hypothetical protein